MVVASLSIMINIIACAVCIRHCRSDYDDPTGELFVANHSLVSVDLGPEPDEYALYTRTAAANTASTA